MAKADKWFVYIIETENGKLYTGITTDVERRFEEHKNDPKGAKFTKANPPKKILFTEEHLDRSSASKREAQIKKLSRPQKLILINNK
ncbi:MULTISPECIES: GIY-YIG nuclease family protein [Halobacteriovorax]|uniref:GIY-YIG nuclease family protein n=1 Tax=Halobacteriovorax vibrionivorans TaxID=2152716 RepID=A0ABY0IJ95_9BACT|nr:MULTISPECIES: GIY-YIG nuclease family protein [Halobacteriovorax]RZF22650.1 GIY-YIG nuclease family protein [Halobacteriovorax vibrionivorans]TGD46671.1 GIY-YIG nuclease family protein [Halobacteriovorax sp. Y22]